MASLHCPIKQALCMTPIHHMQCKCLITLSKYDCAEFSLIDLRSAIWNKLYYDALYRSCSGHNNHVLAKARNSPLPSTTQQTMEANAMIGAFASLVVTVPLLIVPGAFVAFQVKERQSKARHLQLMSGSNLSTVLLSSYLYDLLHFWLLIAAVLLTIFLCGGTAAEIFLSTPEKQMVTGLLLTGFSMSVLPFSYLIARGYRYVALYQLVLLTSTCPLQESVRSSDCNDWDCVCHGLCRGVLVLHV